MDVGNKIKQGVAKCFIRCTSAHEHSQQIILVKGHTMMEADSVHSTLGTFQTAHPHSSPLHNENGRNQMQNPLKHPFISWTIHFIKDYENLPNNHHSIRPGRKPRDPTIAEIRGQNYMNGEIFQRTRQIKEWVQLPQ